MRVTNLENSGGGGGGTNPALERRVADLEEDYSNMNSLLIQDECSSNPCMNGGTCIDLYNKYSCLCTPAWQGTRCEQDVNECSTIVGTVNDCQNGGSCVNQQGSYSCDCTPDYYGALCTMQYDDCNSNSVANVCDHGYCVNLPRILDGVANFDCICFDGWQKDSSSSNPACSVDVDECNGREYPCSAEPLVSCTNVDGSYYCGNCPTGYDGNGHQCLDVNECQTNNGGCSSLVQCTNTVGSRVCGPCPVGYVGDGVTCTYVGICNVNNGGCDSVATCQENSAVPDGRTCTCPSGYTGNGIGSGGCTPSQVSCNDNPCVHGRCEYTGSGYRCICEVGWTSTNCDVNINDCSTNPCQNGGTCIDDVDGFICQCQSGWAGPTCTDTSVACGGYQYGVSGEIQFPGEGQLYPHGVSCAWVIDTTDDKVIHAVFERFEVEPGVDCSHDFLQVHDGDSASANNIGKFCGTDQPDNITSTHDTLYFWFFTDASVNSGGFKIVWSARDPVCGGALTGSNHGSLQSPGYPGNYPVNRDCVWTITVDAGRYITIAFGDLHLENHPTCDYDYLKVIDGLNEADPVLGTFCSSSTPAPVDTSGNAAFLRFHSDASETDVGFQLTYTSSQVDPGCGGALTDDSGIIISPNYPNAYDHNKECIWTIEVPVNEVITLTITDLLMEESTNCVYDYVEVRDGFNENAPFIGRYCQANSIPPPLTSSGNTMWIKFMSDGSVNAGGFRATYEISCGGVFTTAPGSIQSPYYPQAYPNSRECEYVITAGDGQVVTLTFSAFDIEDHASCQYDYLEVRDGASSSANLIATLCGAQIPAPITTTSNSMYLKFVTDASVTNLGFSADYAFFDEGDPSIGCGGTFTATSGSFSSPSDGNAYPHGAHCVYNIVVDPGLVIRLSFDAFALEDHSNCNYDYVEVYDNGTTPNVTFLGRYCGSTPPHALTSTTNRMSVVFSTDGSIALDGFTASYIAADASTLCGGTLLGNTGAFSSPNYPNNYPDSRDCTWVISATEGQQIKLNFTDFELEPSTDCIFDYVKIWNGAYDTSPLVGTFCGSSLSPSTFISHSHTMRVTFHTDSSITYTGFNAIYDSTATGCGGVLTSPEGSFSSPNYPYPYGHSALCVWTITVARGSQIVLTFDTFDVEDHSSCVFDYVKVYDGLEANSALLGTFCGTTVPAPQRSRGNSMRIEWQTDSSVSGDGFLATYQEDCDDIVLTTPEGFIESPNYPNPYPHDRDCSWVITTTVGNTINFTFVDLNIESHSTCSFDYVRLVDGQTTDDTEIVKLCGSDTLIDGVTYASSQEYMRLEFHSDFSVATAGFQGYYVINGCGGQLTGNNGSLSSPNYPAPYDHSRVCEWVITVDLGYSVVLTIDDIEIEHATGCQFDSLRVYSGNDANGFLLGEYCLTLKDPVTIPSTGNQMFVQFTTDASVSFGGFHATYQARAGGCGGNYSTPHGDLRSPDDGSGRYPHNTDCFWTITVEDNHRVALTFLSFELEGASSCQYDYVKLYDGPDDSYPLLLTQCGAGLPDPPLIYSSGNQMSVHMFSDSSVSYSGFHATYETVCGGRRDATVDGYIESSNYPDNYPNDLNCSWIIESNDPLDRVTLIFTHLDLEFNPPSDCHDYVTVRQGNSETAPEVGTYCGTTVPAPITSVGPSLFVSLFTDSSISGQGFRATYSTSDSACGGTFAAMSGSITSPSYPTSYPQDVECVWLFPTSAGNSIQVSFSVFNIESSNGCAQDYVEFRQGSETGALIGRFCGDTIPSNVTSTGTLWMKFRSDSQSTGVGFMANYAHLFGGDLSGNSGTIESPLYPAVYPHYVSARWTVTVPAGNLILFTYTAFDVESHSSCAFDYVKILDGVQDYSPILQVACGTDIPSPVQTTGNVGSVVMSTDYSVAGTGFQLGWLAVSGSATIAPGTPHPNSCGGPLSAVSSPQTFSSPGFPDGYATNLDCIWIITAPINDNIILNFTSFALEFSNDCVFDWVRIYDGAANTDSLLNEFCGSVSSLSFSTGNVMRVEFHTDISINMTGFEATYQTGCGGHYTSPSGTIQSPGYPSNYGINLDCTYYVETATGSTIGLQFQELDLEASTSCSKDMLYLLNGGSVNSPPLGTSPYCGTTEPADLVTSSNRLTVRIVTDEAGSGRGFSLSYVTQTAGCGGHRTLTSTSDTGFISSTNWPNSYDQNTECVWVISGPQGSLIRGVFDNTFYIEPHESCVYDYVEVRDGSTASGSLIGQYCGSTAPSPVTTTGNAMYVRFSTDQSVTHEGFKMTYSTATCGGSFSGSSGSFNSPNHPANYAANQNCEWYVTGPIGHYLTLTFSAFGISGTGDCSAGDYVRIHDGRNASASILGTYCGSSIPASVDTSSYYAYIVFVSNSDSQTGSGFSLQFTSSEEVCGGDLVTSTGSFSSPGYPNQYDHSRVCEWRITVQQGHLVTLYFDDFDVEDASSCSYDYVAVYNGLGDNAPLLDTLCGVTTPNAISSSGNTMKVIFRTDGSVSGRGFSARYDSSDASVCGGQLTVSPGESAYIMSPQYGLANYSNNLNCEWVLGNAVNVNSSMYLSFVGDFDLETHTTCVYDYLQVFEGVDDSGVELVRFCGTQTPDPFFIPFQTAFLRFRTDGSIVGLGFRMQYEASACGGVVTGTNGVITSPNYPQPYDHNDHCVWRIEAPAGETITYTFTAFDIETHENCEYDYLSVRNGGFWNSPQISGQNPYCGSTAPPAMTSSGNMLFVTFVTDVSLSAQGFEMAWTTETSGCGGNYHSSTGVIKTPNYPQSYDANTECVWTLYTQESYHINLDFNPTFGIGAGDTVEFFDGDDEDAPSLGTFTSSSSPARVSSTNRIVTVRFRSDAASQSQGFQATWTSECGVEYREVHEGSIHSPGYPNVLYPNNANCDYKLTFDATTPVLLNFEDPFDVESHGTCAYDGVRVYAGTDAQGTLVGTYCGTSTPSDFEVVGPVFINFYTDGSVQGTGFQLNFEYGCGGVFTGDSGVIQTPPHIVEYRNDQNCTWIITVNSDKIVEFKFETFELEAHSNCAYDYVQIYDGTDFSTPLTGRFCGDVTPTGFFFSTGNSMLINMVTDYSVTAAGFTGAYVATYGPAQGCGGTLTDASGSISSFDINNDGQYENSVDCKTQILLPDINTAVQLNFTGSFDVGSTGSCDGDYIEIRDGLGSSAPFVGRFCGNKAPPVITLSGNKAYVVFHTDDTGAGSGFTMAYTSVDLPCGGILYAADTPQTLTSPNYPANYSVNQRCGWTIDGTNATNKIRLTVTDLSLENDCDNDYVEFRDQPENSGHVLRYCGTNIPPVFDSSGQTVLVYFASDSAPRTTYKGFSLEYQIADCNRNYNTTHGTVMSPGYPNIYNNGHNCSWRITTPADTFVALYFTHFNVEGATSCVFDSVTVYNGSDSSAPIIGTFCGNTVPPPIFASGNELYIRFITDSSITYGGFDATFTSAAVQGCGGQLMGRHGSFTSPMHPGEYPASQTCDWNIEVPAGGQSVTLSFTNFAVEGTEGECAQDRLEVYDGTDASAPLFGRYCGTSRPADIRGTGRNLFVRFITNGQNPSGNFQYTGFRAIFES
ncbi:cubilin-like [Diadema setosum]|uniref:cubilin-like n=1 Tax=Diadema setosum TaxID=31175 RepID=UPI003B3A3AD3